MKQLTVHSQQFVSHDNPIPKSVDKEKNLRCTEGLMVVIFTLYPNYTQRYMKICRDCRVPKNPM